ncbi:MULTISPECIES: GspE/PulE family protein [unclassified Aureimonas]|uniref:GspE/PulE family protein n=1 Tax=unclassified Aureimonas TaxID=2615206 RepID=UPI0006FFCD3D|nr:MULTISPECIES: GspE/PulE family protein [unclassified Aureimonas]KQT69876.1 general secretion pathway protein GspE [Aureimonas sp. Leaf427]KQT75970.1 general secretion pathway protein GspE [Aureimonas sp. Leaf460]
MADRRLAVRGSAMPTAEDFLAHLVATGLLEVGAADRARAAAETLPSLPNVLTELGLLDEADLVAALAAFTGLAAAAPEALPAEPILVEAISADYCRRARILPLAADPSPVLAVVDPFRTERIEALLYALGGAELRLIGPNAFETACRRLYGEEGAAAEAEADHPVLGGDMERLEDAARQAPIIRLANTLFRIAFELGASDIHIEPGESELVARFRVDGVLVRPEVLPKSAQTGLATRIKILSELNIAERRLPQDGRMKLVDRGREVDVRVSVLPTAHGEALVLRLLGQSKKPGGYEALGFPSDLAGRIDAMAARPNGIFLVTGPTGSGKTTTLYTLLQRLNDGRNKIVTVEDPVEYRVSGVTQVQTHSAIGLDFAAALRSILRQDPDIVMVGEIRDRETAEIAVQAALTGHLVLSTLHTNSAAAAVTRLVDMGVEPYLLAAVLNGVLAQRLLRLLCTDCRTVAVATPAERAILRRHRPALAGAEGVLLAHAKGCPACNGTGYRGRTVVAEGLEIDRALSALVSSGAGERALEDAARGKGMETLAAHGIAKALALETSLEEVLRHLGGGDAA